VSVAPVHFPPLSGFLITGIFLAFVADDIRCSYGGKIEERGTTWCECELGKSSGQIFFFFHGMHHC